MDCLGARPREIDFCLKRVLGFRIENKILKRLEAVRY